MTFWKPASVITFTFLKDQFGIKAFDFVIK